MCKQSPGPRCWLALTLLLAACVGIGIAAQQGNFPSSTGGVLLSPTATQTIQPPANNQAIPLQVKQATGGTAVIFQATNAGGNNYLTVTNTGPTVVVTFGLSSDTYGTATNCSVNSASPAACGSAAAGAFVVPTTTTAYTVNTTAVTAHSRIMLASMSFAGDLPSTPTCVVPTTPFIPALSAISAGASFSLTLPSTTGQTCWEYWIVD